MWVFQLPVWEIAHQRCCLRIPFNPGRLLKYCTVLIVGVPYWYDSLLYSWHSKDGESAWLYIPPVVNDHTARCIICLWLWSSPWWSSAIWFPFGGQVFVIIETGANCVLTKEFIIVLFVNSPIAKLCIHHFLSHKYKVFGEDGRYHRWSLDCHQSISSFQMLSQKVMVLRYI